MVSAVAEAVAAPQHTKGGIRNVQSEQSILDVAKIEEGVQDIDLSTKAPGTMLLISFSNVVPTGCGSCARGLADKGFSQ